MFKKELEERNSVLFEKLVPVEGKCDTLEGEILRAVNKICYRYWNDGDYFYKGYGAVTAGNAAGFLYEHGFGNELNSAIGLINEAYEAELNNLLDKVLTFVESKGETYSPNEDDMFDYESPFEDEEDEDYDED